MNMSPLRKDMKHHSNSINLKKKFESDDCNKERIAAMYRKCDNRNTPRICSKYADNSVKSHTDEWSSIEDTSSTISSFSASSIYSSDSNAQRKKLIAEETPLEISEYVEAKKAKNVQVNFIHVNFTEPAGKKATLPKSPKPRVKQPSRKTRGTQSLYRISSAQTLPYTPELIYNNEELKKTELFKLAKILKIDGPPGLYEVEVLERARKRWAFLKSVKAKTKHSKKAARHKAEFDKHKHILKAFEWEHWMAREENIQDQQAMRLELLVKKMNEREYKMHTDSQKRLEASYKRIKEKRRNDLRKNAVAFVRGIRALTITDRTWRKRSITYELSNPGSDFNAPKIRYGINPNRRHCDISNEAFDMRIKKLENETVNMDPEQLKCPLAKLRELSKPKQRVREFEQKFCSEQKLKKLYENLKSLRQKSKRKRIEPECLLMKYVKRAKPKVMIEDMVDEERVETKDVPLIQYGSLDSDFIPSDTDQRQLDDSLNGSLTLKEMHDEAEKRREYDQLREQKLKEKMENDFFRLELEKEDLEIFSAVYEGRTVGWLMQFFVDEHCRNIELEKLYFFCMMAQKERWHREAMEAGLRQKENILRSTYEKIYEECETANIEIAEECIKKIMNTDVEDYADQTAEDYIMELAKIVDNDIQSWLETFNEVEDATKSTSVICSLRSILMGEKKSMLERLERNEVANYIVYEVLLENVYEKLDGYDVSTSITNELVDRLIDNDLYLFSSECSSMESDYVPEFTLEAQHEAKAIIRKLVRRSVPGRRWRTPTEVLAHANIEELIDDVFDFEKSKTCVNENDKDEQDLLKESVSYLDEMDSDIERKSLYSEDSSEPSIRCSSKILREIEESRRKAEESKVASLDEILVYSPPINSSDSSDSSESLDSKKSFKLKSSDLVASHPQHDVSWIIDDIFSTHIFKGEQEKDSEDDKMKSQQKKSKISHKVVLDVTALENQYDYEADRVIEKIIEPFMDETEGLVNEEEQETGIEAVEDQLSENKRSGEDGTKTEVKEEVSEPLNEEIQNAETEPVMEKEKEAKEEVSEPLNKELQNAETQPVMEKEEQSSAPEEDTKIVKEEETIIEDGDTKKLEESVEEKDRKVEGEQEEKQAEEAKEAKVESTNAAEEESQEKEVPVDESLPEQPKLESAEEKDVTVEKEPQQVPEIKTEVTTEVETEALVGPEPEAEVKIEVTEGNEQPIENEPQPT